MADNILELKKTNVLRFKKLTNSKLGIFKINLLHFKYSLKELAILHRGKTTISTNTLQDRMLYALHTITPKLHAPLTLSSWHPHHIHPLTHLTINYPHFLCLNTIIPLKHTWSHTTVSPPSTVQIHSVTLAIGFHTWWLSTSLTHTDPLFLTITFSSIPKFSISLHQPHISYNFTTSQKWNNNHNI